MILAPRVAILVPCYNEATTIAKVVGDFRRVLPNATIHVFDNNSVDGTADRALEAGAQVRAVRLQGKGHVVRRLFADVEADVYLLVDGDDTYHADSADQLVQLVWRQGHDMAVAVREATVEAAYRVGHVFGNRLLTGFLAWLFGRPCRDVLSGYRAFSRRFVKSFPVLSAGFEIETELTVHALELHMPVGEVVTPYKDRPEGSVSKLNTWGDGFRILRTIVRLFNAERPLAFYGAASMLFATTAMVLAVPLVLTWLHTGEVPRLPTAVLATGLMLVAALSATAGIVLDMVARGRREAKMLAYVALVAPGNTR